MKKIGIVMALVLGLGMSAEDADAAKRLGGGRTVGVQRQAVTPKPSSAPAQQAAPAQPTSPAASPASPQTATAPAAQPRPGMGRWLAPLAGLAAGLGLAALFGHEMGSMLTALLLGLAIVMFVAFFLRRMRGPQPAAQGTGYNAGAYAGYGSETVAAPPPSQPMLDDPEARRPVGRIPEGFDVDGFLRQAKRAFIGLQMANDNADLAEIRDLTTDEMYAELQQDVAVRAGTKQQIDVVALDAELLEVTTENDAHWASIEFSGLLRESASGAASPFEEVWHLRKSTGGKTGWLLAGIQQLS